MSDDVIILLKDILKDKFSDDVIVFNEEFKQKELKKKNNF